MAVLGRICGRRLGGAVLCWAAAGRTRCPVRDRLARLAVAAVLMVGAGVALASTRTGRGAPVALITAGLWAVVPLALAGSALCCST